MNFSMRKTRFLLHAALIFPGQYFDTLTGLHQNWHREYDPAIGRYREPDPLGLTVARWPGEIDTVGAKIFGTTILEDSNPYAYAGSNPINFMDPHGLQIEMCCRRLGKSLWLARHCFIRITDVKGKHHTYGLHPVKGCGRGKLDDKEWKRNPPPRNCVIIDPVPPADHTKTCIHKNHDKEQFRRTYYLGGPNSNTYIRCLLSHCGYDPPKDPPGWTPGWQDRYFPRSRAPRGPSRRELQRKLGFHLPR